MSTRPARRRAARALGGLPALLMALLLVAALVGCGGGNGVPGGEATAQRATPSSGAASPPTATFAGVERRSRISPDPRSRAGLDDWDVGGRVLPTRPDGFGVVRRTPAELRVRLLPTSDLLTPPPDDRFRSRVDGVTRAWVRRTSFAWTPGCPVPIADLRLLRLTFRGFDGLPHAGRMVVHRQVARDVVGVFRTLYAADYPIEQMALARLEDLDAPPTGDGNVTGAYACRATRGATTWSAHAYGLAVDVNPFMNPYVDGDLVLPELASAYTRRGWRRPGMIRGGDVVTRAFADIGWSWGGDFRSVSDPMHFSATGR